MADGKRDLVKEAVKDARAVRDAAVAAAKNELIESMAPKIRALVERTIGEKVESVDRSRVPGQGSDYYAAGTRQKQAKFQEGDDKGEEPMPKKDDTKNTGMELDMESIAGFFPQLAEEPAADPDAEAIEAEALGAPMGIPMLGEEPEEGTPKDDEEEPKDEASMSYGAPMTAEGKKKKDDDKELDEEVEISDAELRKVYESAQLAEVQVKKDFGEMVGGGELEDAAKEPGILDVKKGDKPWNEEEPPAKKDFTVKELFQRGIAENRQLRAKLDRSVKIVESLSRKLHEVNLFNSKVLHVNRILNRHGRLTAEQRRVVLESIDAAASVAEVQKIYEALVGSFAAAKAINESRVVRKPNANAQRARTSGGADPKVLSESADRGSGDGQFARMQLLAGLSK